MSHDNFVLADTRTCVRNYVRMAIRSDRKQRTFAVAARESSAYQIELNFTSVTYVTSVTVYRTNVLWLNNNRFLDAAR